MIKKVLAIITFCIFCHSTQAREFYRCKAVKFLHVDGSGTTTDVPIGDDFTFSFIWDWQNEQAFFDGMPLVAGNLGGLETINIDRQNDDWFTINSFWYRFNYSFNKFFYSGNDSNYLIVISGKCEVFSFFILSKKIARIKAT